MKPEIEELLKKFELFPEEKQPLLFGKKIDENTFAYVDFRKPEFKEKGRRFVKQGDNFDIDPNTIPELKMFKEERDKILQSSGVGKREAINAGDMGKENFSNTPTTTISPVVKNPPSPTSINLLEVIKNDYEADILEVFAPSGACKTKLMVELARLGKSAGKKVKFVDTERNLRKAEINVLGDSYQYLPGINDLDQFCKNLPKEPEIIIIDSIGYPILTEWARMTSEKKGEALTKLIAWKGDLKDWAINNNKLVIITNQPDSDFMKGKDYINKPFGDKAQFASKEIWVMERLGMKKGITVSAIRTFRSRIKGYGLDIAQIQIDDTGTTIKVF